MFKVEWDNDTGPEDDYYIEWWEVCDGNMSFRSYDEMDALWLCELLNASLGNR